MIGKSDLDGILSGKRVFITGHTGFKGCWLSQWLLRYKCQVTGYALQPETSPQLFSMLQLERGLSGNHIQDIRDKSTLASAMQQAEPELVIHLAAQSLVRRSYQQTDTTWSTNVMGTVNLLEAVRHCPSVKAVVVITTDKCYDNQEWSWGYRESDMLGGHDPYSASKAATELVVSSYRKSFFNDTGVLLASARAGNVIGGGDWSDDRLIPDAARSASGGNPLMIRNPNATRPWQHVLDCLCGYLLLAANLLERNEGVATAFNFGPSAESNLRVDQVLSQLQVHWPELNWEVEENTSNKLLHEANFLYLDSSLSRQQLNWSPDWQVDQALEKTALWYRAVIADARKVESITNQQLSEYINL